MGKLKLTPQQLWFGIYGLFFIFSITSLISIFGTRIFWPEANALVHELLGFRLNAVIIVLILLGFGPMIYASSLMFLSGRSLLSGIDFNPKKIHRRLPLLLLLLAIGVTIGIRFVGYMAHVFPAVIDPYLLPISLICAGILIFGFNLIYKKILVSKHLASNTAKKGVLVTIIAVFLFPSFLPFIWGSPVLFSGDLPQRPGIFGHRGADSLAPEDTLISGEVAFLYEHVVGWEVDVRLTADGVPVLLHDSTLSRTTDVESKFPNRKGDLIDTFTLAEIKSLDAGSWFVDMDPYGTIAKSIVDESYIARYPNTTVPTLAEALNLSIAHNKMIYLDLKGADVKNSYYAQYFERVIDVILASGIRLDFVQIEQMNAERYAYLVTKNATLIMGGIDVGTPKEFNNANYPADYVVTMDSYSNYQYYELNQAGIPVHVWTVNTPQRYAQLWQMGVDWVMTDDVHILNDVKFPTTPMSNSFFIALWIGVYCCIIVVIIFSIKRTKTV
jgi:glycerophosphoryl diester phosphodiesterase